MLFFICFSGFTRRATCSPGEDQCLDEASQKVLFSDWGRWSLRLFQRGLWCRSLVKQQSPVTFLGSLWRTATEYGSLRAHLRRRAARRAAVLQGWLHRFSWGETSPRSTRTKGLPRVSQESGITQGRQGNGGARPIKNKKLSLSSLVRVILNP